MRNDCEEQFRTFRTYWNPDFSLLNLKKYFSNYELPPLSLGRRSEKEVVHDFSVSAFISE